MKSEKKPSRKTAKVAVKRTISAIKLQAAPAATSKAGTAKRSGKTAGALKVASPPSAIAKPSAAAKAPVSQGKPAAKPVRARRVAPTPKSVPKSAAGTKAVKTPVPVLVPPAAKPVAANPKPVKTSKLSKRVSPAKAKTVPSKKDSVAPVLTKAKTPIPIKPKVKPAKPAASRKPVKRASTTGGKRLPTAKKVTVAIKRTAKPATPKPAAKAQPTAKPAPTGMKSPRTSRTIVIKPRKRILLSREQIPAILFEGDESPAPVVSGPGQRYALGPSAPPEPAAAGVIQNELPDAYGTRRLTLTARDPHWLYAAWDLTSQQLADYNALAREGHLVLRVYLNTIAGQPLLEILVHPTSRNWFIHGGRGGTKYMAELGYYTATGEWVSISTSKATLTPPDSLAEDTTARFANLPVDIPLPELVELVKAVVTENVPLIEAFQQLREQGHKNLPEIVVGAPTVSWTPEQERALAEVITMDSVRQVWVGSMEITELVRRQLEREISSVSAVPPGRPGARGKQPGAPAANAGAVSSPLGGEQSARGFWFNVNAELIIYGATEPGATVTIAGRPIKLRPDGSFSYRFALPDGRYELPAVAVSADRAEARHAELQFRRSTRYTGEVGAHPLDETSKPPLADNVD